jgi:UDP-N-acetylglucosamine/UDP-N-acetylgalactosamine diphosphorylase
MSNYDLHDIKEQLGRFGQTHLLRWWDELSTDGQQSLVRQVEAVDFSQIAQLLSQYSAGQQRAESENPAERARRALPPSEVVRLPASAGEQAERAAAAKRGRALLAAGKVGAILVAGGQGTRLGFDHPKGMFPIGEVSESSLFQIFAEQLAARSRQAGSPIPYYIMTSAATHEETVRFFQKHDLFGLRSEDLFFFQQGNMPAVDSETGRLLLQEQGKLCTGPDGHGGLLSALARAGLLEEMRGRGIEQLYYHQVDNPTAIVCDPVFLGFHIAHGSEMTTKVVAKAAPEEKMGVVVDVDGQTQIVEYTDMPDDVAEKTDAAGKLVHWAGSTAIHVFSRQFFERLVEDKFALPFHLAHKKVPFLDDTGRLIDPPVENAFKFERFIFEAMPLAEKTLVVEADRAREFNPVKKETGTDSPETARAAMTSLFGGWLREAEAVVPESEPVEISPLYALDAADVREKVSPGTKFTGPVYLK